VDRCGMHSMSLVPALALYLCVMAGVGRTFPPHLPDFVPRMLLTAPHLWQSPLCQVVVILSGANDPPQGAVTSEREA
jgi:hypothetical protein